MDTHSWVFGLASKCLELAQLLHPLAGGPVGPKVRYLQFELDTQEAASLSPQHTAGGGLEPAHRAVGLSVSATHRNFLFLAGRAGAADVNSWDKGVNMALLLSHPSHSHIRMGLTLESCASTCIHKKNHDFALDKGCDWSGRAGASTLGKSSFST